MRRFKKYSLLEFETFIENVKIERPITNVQIHHTAVPTLNGYRLAKDKEMVIRSMWTYHTATRGFQDIAQHFSIAPDGIWDGRSLEIKPGGFLGNQNDGGLMFEIIGFYDKGKESFSGDIFEMTMGAVAAIKKKFPKAEIRFHRDQPNANKTCPGSAIDKAWFENQLSKRLHKPSSCDVLYGYGVPFGYVQWEIKEFSNPVLASALKSIADNYTELSNVPYFGDLLIKIGEKMKMK